MADLSITSLPAATAPVGGSLFPMVVDGVTSKVTLSDVLKFVYPVGSIYTAVNATNPATVFGFGTWVAFGSGRVLVGLDSGNTLFDTVEETGGELEHVLTESELASHTHTQDSHNHTQDTHTHTQDSHNHTQDTHTHTQNSHNHSVVITRSATTGASTTEVARTQDTSSTILAATTADATATNQNTVATNQAATATNQNTVATNQAATATNQNSGGDTGHNNVQPYIVVYMFKRTV